MLIQYTEDGQKKLIQIFSIKNIIPHGNGCLLKTDNNTTIKCSESIEYFSKYSIESIFEMIHSLFPDLNNELPNLLLEDNKLSKLLSEIQPTSEMLGGEIKRGRGRSKV